MPPRTRSSPRRCVSQPPLCASDAPSPPRPPPPPLFFYPLNPQGNHEACGACPGIAALPDSTHNFTEYKARFHSVALNSNTGNNRYYSFNKGLTHFIVFTAEAYLYARDEAFLANQLAFMKADLEAVDRTVTPWVVGLVHKDWTMEAEAFKAFSPILQGGNVDVLFVGHVHYYNRYMP